ncbi:lipase family protein [Streptomyces sp. NBC_01304]|uniref:lipase family protein n=1 Tax=Streptomyces sp. NBC_01304 TaxID=2903818 RepID=UPI002E16391A|nr:lipase family protein [Streptomyces sp. NBC_01304]
MKLHHPIAGKYAVAIAVLTALVLPSTGATAADPRPATAREDRAGSVVGSTPATAGLLPGLLTQPTDAWRITYRSRGATGRSNTVSGLVVVPRDGRKGPRPLIAFAPGTVGLADRCASSRSGFALESLLFDRALRKGWAMVVTDYEGLGTPGEHTYLVGRAEGQAVLDAARAAQRLPQARARGVDRRSPVGIVGYSQGGHAAAWAAQLHAAYAPDLDLKGTAAGGVPANLLRAFAHNDGGPGSGFALMAAIGHDAAYPELGLARYLNPEGRRLARLASAGCVGETLAAMSGKRMSDITHKNPLDAPLWRKRMRSSDPGRIVPDRPVFLFQGQADELIPYEDVPRLRSAWSRGNDAVTLRSVPFGNHATTVLDSLPPVQEWLDERLTKS